MHSNPSLWRAYTRMLLWTVGLAVGYVLVSAWLTGVWPLTRQGEQGLSLTLLLILLGQSAVFWLRETVARKAGKQ